MSATSPVPTRSPIQSEELSPEIRSPTPSVTKRKGKGRAKTQGQRIQELEIQLETISSAMGNMTRNMERLLQAAARDGPSSTLPTNLATEPSAPRSARDSREPTLIPVTGEPTAVPQPPEFPLRTTQRVSISPDPESTPTPNRKTQLTEKITLLENGVEPTFR